jgi:predicted glycoside hydrolase/deacetylase ChbG (UPF0249 family)
MELVGAAPTHMDSHHDSHRDPRVLLHLLAAARRTGVPVRHYSGVRHVGNFYGQWGGETHLEQISLDGLLRLLDEQVRQGVTELTCHPGYIEAECRSSYTAEREVEVRTLCDHRLGAEITVRQIRLAGFRDLPSPATVGVS